MYMNENIENQIISMINRSNKILLLPSSPPDGDSIGSTLAMYLVLKKIGKDVTAVCSDPIPDVFKFFPTLNVIKADVSADNDFIVTLDCVKKNVKEIRHEIKESKFNIIITPSKGRFIPDDVTFSYGPSKFDLIITVDTCDLSQIGKFYEHNTELFTTLPIINIDHHATNLMFGKVNLVDEMASSTTEILISLINKIKPEENLIDEDIATLLLAGIITDTGSFQNANTTPRSLESAAYLLSLGARQQEIIKHVFKTKNLSTLKLWGKVLSKIQYDKDSRIVWSKITEEDLKSTKSSEDESGGIIDELLSNAPGSEVILLLKQKKDNLISVSVRTTKDSVNASKIAEMFGGGGHVRAAGFKIKDKTIEEAEKIILKKVRKFQENRGITRREIESSVSEPNLSKAKVPQAESKQSEDSSAENSKKAEENPKDDTPENPDSPIKLNFNQ